MVQYKPRSAWKARPPKPGPGPMHAPRVQGVVIHWPGSGETDSFDSNAEIGAALRGWQTFHMDDRKWSDIAYQVAVDQDGGVWTLRGFGTKSGANGNATLNEEYGAILLILVAGEEPSAAMKASVRAVISDFRERFPGANAIRPHSAVRPDGTDCPGPKARAALNRGDFTPGHTTPPPEDDMSAADVQEIKNFTEQRLKAYADATATFVRQTVAAYSKSQSNAIIAAVNAGDDKVADQIIDAIEASEDERAAALIAAVHSEYKPVDPAAVPAVPAEAGA